MEYRFPKCGNVFLNHNHCLPRCNAALAALASSGKKRWHVRRPNRNRLYLNALGGEFGITPHVSIPAPSPGVADAKTPCLCSAGPSLLQRSSLFSEMVLDSSGRRQRVLSPSSRRGAAGPGKRVSNVASLVCLGQADGSAWRLRAGIHHRSEKQVCTGCRQGDSTSPTDADHKKAGDNRVAGRPMLRRAVRDEGYQRNPDSNQDCCVVAAVPKQVEGSNALVGAKGRQG